MPYRRTDNVERRLAARHDAILAAASALAAEAGLAAVQIAPVATRAGIAAGTVYRYFPSKAELIAALVAAFSQTEIAALRQAGDAAPGPLSALAAALTTFGARALANRRLAFAVIAEPAGSEGDDARLAFRRALAGEFERRIRAAIAGGHLPEQNPATAAAVMVGLLIEGLIGPLAPDRPGTEPHAAVQSTVLFALRALGVVDARARGLVVQTQVPKMTFAP
jgi:AcrR family transcriptional regulator